MAGQYPGARHTVAVDADSSHTNVKNKDDNELRGGGS